MKHEQFAKANLPDFITPEFVQQVQAICQCAALAILKIYARSVDDMGLVLKADNSPVTAADHAAHAILSQQLNHLASGLPLLSEESAIPPYVERQRWQRYWLIDPLDGTKEFISRRGEFTINVALIDHGIPVFGLVHVPLQQCAYIGVRGVGAWKWQADQLTPLTTCVIGSAAPARPLIWVTSRRHGTDAVANLISRARNSGSRCEEKTIGSSLKFCLIAEGSADFYPRFGPTCEWDTAAAQAVLEAAGGSVVDKNGNSLRYNAKDDLLNPDFFALGDPQFDWLSLLRT
jgi:3'(2'), 5'-bisphosphate nucleotidase